MRETDEPIQLILSRDEAMELLSRCLRSEDPDDEAFRSALQKLAGAIRAVASDSTAA